MVQHVASRLRGFTMRQALRLYAAQYLMIPLEMSDGDALRIFRKALAEVEGEI